MLIDQPNPDHAINSAHKFPSSEQLLRYFHACAVYPTKDTWLKVIWAGNYLSWHGITTKKFNWHYPETYETPKGHMRQVRQRVILKKEKLAVAEKYNRNTHTPLRKNHDIYVRIDQLRDTIYTDQAGKFPITSSRGYKYIINQKEQWFKHTKN